MTLTDEKGNRIYALSGSMAGVKPGDRMTLEGKPKGTGRTFTLEVQKIAADLGACQP
jgi:hypothetical protein